MTERADKVTAFESVRRVRSDVAEYREYDPDRPNATLVSRDEGEEPVPGAVDHAAEALRRLVSRRALETYEHDGHSRTRSRACPPGSLTFRLARAGARCRR
ncbi:hypothetical protein [Sorangium sp. So ce1335]|uniref:hypothetical protein n=1 Tax=Sorangium sp. So ce1335 TaxID=3133335 RepID=UPI003F636EE4